jgi:hypothetical protein
MKVHCFEETIDCNFPDNLLAKTLVINLAKLWTKLIGQKTLTSPTPSFLGIRVT